MNCECRGECCQWRENDADHYGGECAGDCFGDCDMSAGTVALIMHDKSRTTVKGGDVLPVTFCEECARDAARFFKLEDGGMFSNGSGVWFERAS